MTKERVVVGGYGIADVAAVLDSFLDIFQRVGWVERQQNPSSFAETTSSTRRRKRRSARLAVKKKLRLQMKFRR
jgi:hypothetical protein